MDRDDAILDYLQDRLSPEERQSFEKAMSEDGSLAAEVDLMRSVRAEMASEPGHENADAVWERLSGSMAETTIPANENRAPWRQILQYAAVALLAIGAWQFTVVPRLGAPDAGFRTASDPSEALVLQVKFRDDAVFADIGALLGPLGGSISEGPSAIGVVRVSFATAEERDTAMDALKAASDLVELVLEQ